MAKSFSISSLAKHLNRLLGAFCGSFRVSLTLLMAISTVFHSVPAKAWSFDFESVFQHITSSKEPMDERVLLEYNLLTSKNSDKRSLALLVWLAKSKYQGAIESFLKTFNAQKPNLAKTIANRGVGQEQLLEFFAESLLLFSVLKNRQTSMVENQYVRFRRAWLGVDLRLLPKPGLTLWSTVLIGILRLSLQSLEPWTETELSDVQAFMDSREELKTQSAKPILKQISELASFEPKDPYFTLFELTSIFLSGLPTVSASMAILVALSLYDSVKSFAEATPYTFVLCGVAAVSFLVGSCYLPITRSPPAFIPLLHKRFSYIFRYQKFDCRRFLSEPVNPE